MAIKHFHIPQYSKLEMYAEYWSIPMLHTNSLRISECICSKLFACGQAGSRPLQGHLCGQNCKEDGM